MSSSDKSATQIRVLAIDDSEEFLSGLKELLSEHSWLRLVGTAHGVQAGFQLVERLRPDLVLMDAVMPDVDGFAATRRIKLRPHAPKVVIVTFLAGATPRLAARAAGADGCVTKSEIADSLLPLIRSLWDREPETAAHRDDDAPGAVRPAGGNRTKPAP